MPQALFSMAMYIAAQVLTVCGGLYFYDGYADRGAALVVIAFCLMKTGRNNHERNC